MKELITSLLAMLLVLVLAACGSGDNTDNKIKVPDSSTGLKGEDYKDVMTLLQVAGFTNIEVNVLDDLITGWLTKDGEVEKVSINGATSFSASSKYPHDAKIVITYHTFPSKESKKVPETNKAKEKSGVSSGRNVSGFDTITNQTITWCGIDFSFPSYFDVLDKGSTETWMTYYPKKEDYYASIMFQSQEFSGTQEYFNSRIPSIVKSTIDSAYFANTKLQKSEETSIAGLLGWTITFSKSDTDGVISTGSYSFAYNANIGKIAMITCVYDSKDQSQYDYLGDYKKVLETAKLLAEPSVYDFAYIKSNKEYAIYYLIDTDEKVVKNFLTNDMRVLVGTYTGDFDNGIDIRYFGGDMHEKIKFQNADDDSAIILTDPNGFEWTFLKTSVSEAEKILNQDGYTEITSY